MNIIAFLLLTFSVVSQPAGSPGWVSGRSDAITRFDWTTATGYAAHNYLAGRYFYDLRVGDQIAVDGQTYFVEETAIYPALAILDDGSIIPDPAALEVYDRPNTIVLQTCWPKTGPRAGVLLVSARPVQQLSYYFPMVTK